MKTRMVIAVLPALLFGACAGSTACRAPEQPNPAPMDTMYGDLRDKEDCVRNYARACGERNIDRYAELFREDCEFIAVTGTPDIDADIFAGQVMRRNSLEDDLAATAGMFAVTKELRVELGEGPWARLDSLDREPCLDCWETRRPYTISISFADPGADEWSQVMTGRMQFIVSPVDGKWKIFRYMDLPERKRQSK